MMNITSTLNKLISTVPDYQLTKKDRKQVKFEGMDEYIFHKIKSSRYTGSAIPPELAEKVRDIIRDTVNNNKPIHISIPFGGYKKPQFSSAPHLDWAEVFNTIQLREYLTPIATAYPPGVVIEYFSDEIFVSRMNNIPQSDLDLYNGEFASLIKFMNKFTTKNMIFRFSKIRDQITFEELHRRFDREMVKLRKDWNSLTEVEKSFRLRKAERNYNQDLSSVSKQERHELLLNSTLVHDAFIFGDWDHGVSWAFADDMIPVGFRYTGTWGVHIKSSRSSTVQFWVGKGGMRIHDDCPISTILTYKQYVKSGKSTIKVDTVVQHISPILKAIEFFNCG